MPRPMTPLDDCWAEMAKHRISNQDFLAAFQWGVQGCPRFFIEPSFSPKMVDKEVNAVDSEHKKWHGCTMILSASRWHREVHVQNLFTVHVEKRKMVWRFSVGLSTGLL